MGKFNYLWFRNILLLSAGMWGLAMPYAVADDKMKESPITEQVRTKIQVSGVVVDSNGEPLIGATIREKESGNGTITDVDGKFTLSIPVDAVIVVSYVGYRDKLIAVNGKTSFKIELEDDTETLGEVVVVGYGIQKKANLSGSVDQITSTQLEQRPMTDLSKGLQGMVPNLNVDFTSGEPGQAANINIRGEASINGGSPLILIDGVASDAEEMNRLLPEDVESLSVLKDASSAAIYGARAAFGVVLITTKQGKGDRIQVNYNNNFSWKRPSSLTEKTSDPYIYLKLKNIAVLNTPWSSGHVTSDERLEWARQRSDNPDGTEAIRLNPLDNTQWEYMGNRNWTNYFLDKSTFSQAHQLSISGATEKTKFYLSGGVDSEDGVFSGVVKNDKYIRYSMRGKVNYQIWNWLSVSNNTSFVSTTRKKPSYYNLSDFYDAEPHDMDVNPDGTWANSELGIALAQLVDGGEEKTVYDRLQSTFSAEMNFWERMLVLNANFTFSKSHEDYDWYKTKYRIGYGPDDVREQGTSRAYKGSTSELYTVLDLYATLTKSFDKHLVSGVLGFNQEYSRWDKFTADRYDIISTSLPSIGLSSGEQYVDETYKDWAIRGLFFRANYMYDNRFIATVNLRADGSSKLGMNNKWGFFPSASAAWVLNEEAFLKDVDWLSQLKLRAGYGLTGNQDAIEAYNSLALMSPNGVTSVNGNSTATYGFTRNSNPDLRWEVKKTFDVGVDAGILDGRFTLTADWYTSKTTDLLYKYAVPVPPFVYPELLANLGEMTNSGVELAVSGGIVKTKDFDFNMGVNFSYQKNKLNSLSGSYMGQELQAKQYMDLSSMSGAGFVGNNRVVYQMVGQPVGVFYIPRCLGLTPALDENGNAIEGRYVYNLDQTIDGKEGLDTNDGGDRYIAGQAMPKYYLGMNFSFRYKRFDLMTQMNGAFGHKIFNGTSLAYMNLSQFPTYNALAKAPESKIYDQSISDYWLEKGNYLNIDYITLGYNIDCKKIEKYVKNIRVTFSVNNVATITGYSGLSPMINSTTVDKDNNDLGMDNKRFYPLSRTYSLGLSVNF